ncbi:MAG: hypothetical protein Q9169_007789 [Polycauliona sp. 2 TL-2023]
MLLTHLLPLLLITPILAHPFLPPPSPQTLSPIIARPPLKTIPNPYPIPNTENLWLNFRHAPAQPVSPALVVALTHEVNRRVAGYIALHGNTAVGPQTLRYAYVVPPPPHGEEDRGLGLDIDTFPTSRGVEQLRYANVAAIMRLFRFKCMVEESWRVLRAEIVYQEDEGVTREVIGEATLVTYVFESGAAAGGGGMVGGREGGGRKGGEV